MVRVESKIGYCQSKLKWWSRVAIGNITQQLKGKKKKNSYASQKMQQLVGSPWVGCFD